MNKRIIVSALAVTMGAGLVGSISGTVAWYQYSTRAQIGMMGMSIGVDKSLEVAVTAANVNAAPAKNSNLWTTEITTAKLKTALSHGDDFEFSPLTVAGGYEKNAEFGTLTFKSNPIKYKSNPNDWGNALGNEYLDFKVWVRSIEKDGSEAQNADPTETAKELALYDATIKHVENGTKKDISNAVRLGLSAGTNHAIISKQSAELNLYGELDLDKDGEPDKELSYSELNETPATITYGVDGQKGKTYSIAAETTRGTATSLFCDDTVETAENANKGKFGVKGGLNLGATEENNPASFKVRIWLEGWERLGTTPGTASWNTEDYVGSKFFVGFTIASGECRIAAE